MQGYAHAIAYSDIDFSKRIIIRTSTARQVQELASHLRAKFTERSIRTRVLPFHAVHEQADKTIDDFEISMIPPVLVATRGIWSRVDPGSVDTIIMTDIASQGEYHRLAHFCEHIYDLSPHIDRLLKIDTGKDFEIHGMGVHPEILERITSLVYQYRQISDELARIFSNVHGWKTVLKAIGITDGASLKKYGIVEFGKKFGATDLSKFLGTDIPNSDVRMEHLQELAHRLDWEFQTTSPLGTTRDEVLSAFLNERVFSADELKSRGLSWFKKTFGASDLVKILGRAIRNSTISWQDIAELCTLIGWKLNTSDIIPRNKTEKIRIGTTTEEIKTTLRIQGIQDRESLLRYGPTKFKKTFGSRELGAFLGEAVKNGTIFAMHLELLADKLGW